MWAVDVIVLLVMYGAFSVFASTALYALVGTFGEFGPSPCDCEELEAELETVDWLGTGQGIGFESPGIVDPALQEEGLGGLKASRWWGGDHRDDAEVIVGRLSGQPGVEEAPEFHNGRTLEVFRHGQVVIRVERSGDIVIHGPEGVEAVTADIRNLGDTMGRVPRPTPRMGELLLTDYLYWAVGVSTLVLLAGCLWFLMRIVGYFRRRNSTPPPEEALSGRSTKSS